MRCIVLVSVLVGMTSLAAAEPPPPEYLHQVHATQSGMWIDAGAGVERIHPGDNNTYGAEFLRFAPQASIDQHIYIGAELDVGQIDRVIASNNGTPRTTGMDPAPTDLGATGSVVATKAFIGARAIAGIVSGGAELAGGIRHEGLSNKYGAETVLSADQAVFEVHAHLEAWVTPKLTVGGIVGVDLADSQNLMMGLQVGLHFDRYDHARI
jgi:hypothetical protein